MRGKRQPIRTCSNDNGFNHSWRNPILSGLGSSYFERQPQRSPNNSTPAEFSNGGG
jgi:hypothetical protein